MKKDTALPRTWTSQEMEVQNILLTGFVHSLNDALVEVNRGFRFIRTETASLLPLAAHPSGIAIESGQYVLRVDTLHANYELSRAFLDRSKKQRLPLVLWESGRVFASAEQDAIVEAHHLDYHVLYSNTTATAYFPILVSTLSAIMNKLCGPIHIQNVNSVQKNCSQTVQITSQKTTKKLAHMSTRTDFWGGRSIELSIDLDTCVPTYLEIV